MIAACSVHFEVFGVRSTAQLIVSKSLRNLNLAGQPQTGFQPGKPASLPQFPRQAQELDLIQKALNKAVHADQPLRLVSRTDTSALFQVDSGLSRSVISQLLAGKSPLLKRVSKPLPGTHRKVEITRNGIAALVWLTHSDERADLVETAAKRYRKLILLAWVKQSNEAHDYWCSDQQELSQHCSLEELSIADSQNINNVSAASPEKPVEASPQSPQGSAEAAFKRELTHELVISWKYAENTEAKKGIARALLNTGVTQIGEPGTKTDFVGRYHRSEEALFPGDPVRILEPGWLIHDGVGEYLLEKALVEPV